MTNHVTIDVENLAGTEALGRRLGSLLFPGAIVALVGQLGAGKTHFVRAIAVGLDIANPRVVNSPTFVLCQEYNARLPIAHFDAYRLRNAQDFADLGVMELYEEGVALIEWADRVEAVLPAEHLRITIEVVDESRRRFVIEGRGDRYAELVGLLSIDFRST